jgi:ribosomal protein S18 acetylase RimI-like enzyme
MSAPWRIVPMQDLPLAAYVEAVGHGRPWLDPDRFDAWLMHRCFGHRSFLAIEETQPVGAALVVPEDRSRPRALYLDQVVVAPSHRRQGLARALIQRCERLAQEQGASSLWLCTDPHNPAAQGWGRLGFTAEETGTVVNGWPVLKDFKGPGKHRVRCSKTIAANRGASHE